MNKCFLIIILQLVRCLPKEEVRPLVLFHNLHDVQGHAFYVNTSTLFEPDRKYLPRLKWRQQEILTKYKNFYPIPSFSFKHSSIRSFLFWWPLAASVPSFTNSSFFICKISALLISNDGRWVPRVYLAYDFLFLQNALVEAPRIFVAGRFLLLGEAL